MRDPVGGEELKHLRHDLRTPINHILGYTEILIEDAESIGVANTEPILNAMHSGGRAALEQISRSLGDASGVVQFEQLEALEAALRPEAERLLKEAIALGDRFREAGAAEAVVDMERVSHAFFTLLALLRKMVNGAEPAAETTEVAAAAAEPEQTEPDTAEDGAGRILIAEDNPANRDLLRRRLEKEGHRVWEAENGVKALERLESAEYDLLLLDVLMPQMDGFEVLARLKQHPKLQSLPVIMISALDEFQSVVRCIEMGAEDFLPKPFDPVLLKARIGASLEKKRLRDRERRKTEELERTLQQVKEMQAQLVVQEKMASLGALTAGIAHEIKNPLNFVTNFAALSIDLLTDLQETILPVRGTLSASDAEYLDGIMSDLSTNMQRIRDHGRRADSIVRGMLAHSRSGGGQRETADLNALVSEAVNLAYHGLRAQDSTFNIALESDYDPKTPMIQAVAQDLSRVFLNIANNAFYAAHQKKLKGADGFRPTLWVTTRDCGATVEVRIRDNGTGIPKDALQKIFNPFFTTKPTGSGTGLGLSLSYQIVNEQHKGTIQVNTEEGEFTEFVINLPK